MIKPQHFAVLVVATLASIVLAASLYAGSNRWSAGRVEGQLLLPDFGRQINSAAILEIAQGEKRLVFERSGEQWKIKERAGYPADSDKIRTLIVTLAKAELIEPKTAVKERHAVLELEDPSGKDAKSRSVRIWDAKNKPLAEVLLGKSRYDAFGSGRGGVYVRRLGDAQTWLATGEPKATADLKDWVSTTAFETDTSKIQKLFLERAGEEAIVIEKADGKDQKFKLAQMPEGKKLKAGVTIDQIAQAFASIELEDVRRLDPAAANTTPPSTTPPSANPAGADAVTVKLESEGGLNVTFYIRKDGDATWASLAAVGEGEAKVKADEINARSSGWEYKLPAWKADQLNKRRADLFETS